MQNSSQLLTTESSFSLTSTTSLEIKTKKSDIKQKKKKLTSAKKSSSEAEKRSKERKEKKDGTAVLVQERKPPTLPKIADAIPSKTEILAIVKQMKEAEESRRLQDEAKMKVFLEAEAEKGCFYFYFGSFLRLVVVIIIIN